MIHDSSEYTTLYPSTHLPKLRVSDPHRFSPPVLYSLIPHSSTISVINQYTTQPLKPLYLAFALCALCSPLTTPPSPFTSSSYLTLPLNTSNLLAPSNHSFFSSYHHTPLLLQILHMYLLPYFQHPHTSLISLCIPYLHFPPHL